MRPRHSGTMMQDPQAANVGYSSMDLFRQGGVLKIDLVYLSINWRTMSLQTFPLDDSRCLSAPRLPSTTRPLHFFICHLGIRLWLQILALTLGHPPFSLALSKPSRVDTHTPPTPTPPHAHPHRTCDTWIWFVGQCPPTCDDHVCVCVGTNWWP